MIAIMIGISRFERCIRQTHVSFSFCVSAHSCLVHDSAGEALVAKGALGFFLAIAFFLFRFFPSQQVLVVRVNYCFHARHTTVVLWLKMGCIGWSLGKHLSTIFNPIIYGLLGGVLSPGGGAESALGLFL